MPTLRLSRAAPFAALGFAASLVVAVTTDWLFGLPQGGIGNVLLVLSSATLLGGLLGVLANRWKSRWSLVGVGVGTVVAGLLIGTLALAGAFFLSFYPYGLFDALADGAIRGLVFASAWIPAMVWVAAAARRSSRFRDHSLLAPVAALRSWSAVAASTLVAIAAGLGAAGESCEVGIPGSAVSLWGYVRHSWSIGGVLAFCDPTFVQPLPPSQTLALSIITAAATLLATRSLAGSIVALVGIGGARARLRQMGILQKPIPPGVPTIDLGIGAGEAMATDEPLDPYRELASPLLAIRGDPRRATAIAIRALLLDAAMVTLGATLFHVLVHWWVDVA
jgi:hypothetical protein